MEKNKKDFKNDTQWNRYDKSIRNKFPFTRKKSKDLVRITKKTIVPHTLVVCYFSNSKELKNDNSKIRDNYSGIAYSDRD